jgi:hypothetical protein
MIAETTAPLPTQGLDCGEGQMQIESEWSGPAGQEPEQAATWNDAVS